MDFEEALPVTFKEITPNHTNKEKWKEIILNTGGTHSTLQDIKLPQRAGGYWYSNATTGNTRNRFIYWQTTSDAIELTEASMDFNLSSANLRCKVAAGTPPLNGMTIWERHSSPKEMVILAATVSSVHRFIFPHPDVMDRKAFGSLNSHTSIFHNISSINNPNNYYILSQYSNAVAHTCSTLLRENGESVYALAYGQGGEGGIIVIKLPNSGAAVTYILKRESTMPRFLSGITGALRGKSGSEHLEMYDVQLLDRYAVAICSDGCVRAWTVDDGGQPVTVSPPLTNNTDKPKPTPHGHMLKKAMGPNGIVLVAFLSFPNECEFVVIKMQDNGAGVIKFSHVCRLFGPQLDLLDYTIGFGDGNYVVWALWSQLNGDTLITTSGLGADVQWQAVAAKEPPPSLPQLSTHQQYRDHLLAPGLFPNVVVKKAIVIYRRTWGGSEVPLDVEIGDDAMSAVQARLRHLTSRTPEPNHNHLMYKCWSDLYSWCLQYMEGLQKPVGLMTSKQNLQIENGWWGVVIRRSGISIVRELEPLEKMMLSDSDDWESDIDCKLDQLSPEARRVVMAGAKFERYVGAAGSVLERQLFACAAPQHRLLPRLLRLLLCPPQDHEPILTPQQIDELTSMLEPIKDLQNAVLELNDVLRLDVPDINSDKDSFECSEEYDNLFSSDLGISLVTESIKQMAEMRARVVRGCVGAAGAARGADGVPGAGHCVVHWQAYRALLWLAPQTLHKPPAASEELFRLKLNSLGFEVPSTPLRVGGAVQTYVGGAGGVRARAHLAAAGALNTCHHALPMYTYHLAHQLWAVSGSFDFACWLATINQPRLVQNYVSLLEPWCEWNACSRQFILGLALLDLNEPENAYTAFCKAAKGVSTEPFLRQLITASQTPTTQHQALVLYYMKVIKLFEIHDAGACVVRLAETAISIADKDDPNLSMFQWLVFKWHLAGGRVERALNAAVANPAPHARATAAATLLTTLASRNQLGALVNCAALSDEAESAATSRAKLHDAHVHNPYYDFLYALHINRQHYRKAASVMYERACRCESANVRRRYLAASLSCLRLTAPEHAFLSAPSDRLRVIGPEELERELKESDPDSKDIVQQALSTNDNIDFDQLYPKLKDADSETLLSVLKRVISTGQFLPEWFLQRYMAVDSAACIRGLLCGGRVAAAGAASAMAMRVTLRHPLACSTAPLWSPLAAADKVRVELMAHLDDPQCREVYEELEELLNEYMDVVVRTSEDMKEARLTYTI